MQRSTTLLIFLALVVGFILFKVKYEVVETEQQLQQTLAHINREEENIHILKAEWSHLNEPQRLQKLAKKYLDIGPVRAEQVISLADDKNRTATSQSPPPRTQPASIKGEL
jgi:cell division protein FtsL